MSETAAMPMAEAPNARVRSRRTPYFMIVSGLLLVMMIAGFTQTLYLRPVFRPPPIPLYIYLHGVTLSIWFVLLFVQTLLVANRRAALHRQLGLASIGLAGLIVISSLAVMLGAAPRLAVQTPLEGPALFEVTLVFWTNIAMLIGFITFFTLAILNRRRSAAHRPLMVLAAIAMMPPAIARIFRWPGLDTLPDAPLAILIVLMLLISVVVHDIVVNRRFYAPVALGAPAFFVALAFSALVLPGIPAAQEIAVILVR